MGKMTRRLFVGSVGAATVAPVSSLIAAAQSSMSGSENPKVVSFLQRGGSAVHRGRVRAADPRRRTGPWSARAGVPNTMTANTNGRPIQYHLVPRGTPAWGNGWKKAVVKHYDHTVMFSVHGSSVSTRQVST